MEPRKPNPGGEETAEGGTWRGGNGRPQTSVHLWDRDRLLGTFSGCKDQKDYDALSPVCHSRWKWCFTAENMAGGPTNFCLLPNGHFDMFFNFKFYPPPKKKISPHFLIPLLCWALSMFLVCIIGNSTSEVLAKDASPLLRGWHISFRI